MKKRLIVYDLSSPPFFNKVIDDSFNRIREVYAEFLDKKISSVQLQSRLVTIWDELLLCKSANEECAQSQKLVVLSNAQLAVLENKLVNGAKGLVHQKYQKGKYADDLGDSLNLQFDYVNLESFALKALLPEYPEFKNIRLIDGKGKLIRCESLFMQIRDNPGQYKNSRASQQTPEDVEKGLIKVLGSNGFHLCYITGDSNPAIELSVGKVTFCDPQNSYN